MKTTSSSIILFVLLSTSYASAAANTTDTDCSAWNDSKSENKNKVPITTMEGGGKYAASSNSQQETYRRLFPDIVQAVRASHLSDNNNTTPVTLADFGAADGLATRYLLEHITDNIPDVKIDAMINDQDTNDWDSCAHNLSPIGKLNSFSSKDALQSHDREHNVELFSNPGSFTKQLLPNEYVDVATSNMAYHWLSPSTLPSPGRFTVNDNSTDPALAAAWHEHGANDWRNICRARHAELKPGGYFIASVPCVTKNGRYTYDMFFTTVFDPILDRWVEEGLLTAKQRRNIFAPVVARTVAEFEAGMEEYFDIVKIDEVIMANTYLNGVNLENNQDRTLFAQRYTDSIFAVANTLILNAFEGDEKLVEKFKSQLIEGIAARAEDLDNDYVTATIVARKKKTYE